jgi:hypothetical protein
MKSETAKKFIELTESGKHINVEEVSEGLEITWDFDDADIAELVELEHPGTAPEMVQEQFEILMKEIIHASIKHAKKGYPATSGSESDS